MNTFTLWKLFHRRGARGIGERTSALAVIAFAAATTIFLTVLGGHARFHLACLRRSYARLSDQFRFLCARHP